MCQRKVYQELEGREHSGEIIPEKSAHVYKLIFFPFP